MENNGEYVTFEYIQQYVGINDHSLFMGYLRELYKDLAERTGSDRKKGLSKITFYDYIKLPIFIAEKLFDALDQDGDGYLCSGEFSDGMQDLYLGDFDSTVEIVFDLLDFDKDSMIKRDDVKMLLSYLPLRNDNSPIEYKFQMESLEEIDNIVKATFGTAITLKLSEFKKVVETHKSDVYLQILCFLYQKKPFQAQNINLISNSKRRSSGKNPPPLKKKSTPNITPANHIKFLTPSRKSTLSPAEGFFKEAKFLLSPTKKSFTENNTPQVSGIKGMIRLHNETIVGKIPSSTDDVNVTEVLKNSKNIYNTPSAFLKPKNKRPEVSEFDLGSKIVEMDLHIDNPSSEEEEDDDDTVTKISTKNRDSSYENTIFKVSEKGKLKQFHLVIIGKDIYYYKNDKKEEMLGMHNLSGCFVKENGEKTIEGTKYYCFQIVFAGKKRNYFTLAKSIAEEFVINLKEAVGYTNFFDYYEMLDDIGEGKFGLVKLGVHKNTKERVAIKIIKKEKMNESDSELVKSEIDIMKLCHHPNIVRLLDHFENAEYIFIVMEYLSGGDLEHFFQKHKFQFTEERAAEILYQIAEGIEYLHQYGIAHRDLKPENIMLADSTENSSIKIMDFGLSKILGPSEKVVDGFGTLSFVAPEVLVRKPYNKKIDIWSIGVILFYMLSGTLPFDDDDDNEEAIAKMTVFNDVEFPVKEWNGRSRHVIDLINKCLMKDPEKRILINDLFKHEWFASVGVTNEKMIKNSPSLKYKKSTSKVTWADSNTKP